MSSGREALKSDEPSIVKNARGKIKVQVTIALKKLEGLLNKKDGKFDHDQISELEISKYQKRLKDNFDLFDNLHQRYCFLRPVCADEDTEMKEQQVDFDYFDETEVKYDALINLHAEYSESLVKYKDNKKKMAKLESDVAALTLKVPTLRKKFNFDLTSYTACFNSAVAKLKTFVAELQKGVVNVAFPADKMYTEVKEKFNLVNESYKELDEAISASDKEDKLDVALFSHENEAIKVNDLLTDLLAAVNAINDAKSKSVMSTSGATSSKSEPSAVKVAKIDSIKFSGQPRDFSDFHNEFNSVIVPHRSDAEIGIYLRQAVPTQHRHLLDNTDLDDWKTMMNILKEKFGSSKLVIGNVLADLRKIKTITTDKGFVEFVEKVQRAERNLKGIGLSDQLSNAAILNELENKLPHIFYMDWGKKVEADQLNKGHPNLKFAAFMKFLNSCKNIVEDLSLSQETTTKSTVQTNLIIGPPESFKSTTHTRGVKVQFKLKPCLACHDGSIISETVMHDTRNCEVWGALSLSDRQAKVQCNKHPFSSNGHKTNDCKNPLRKACKCGSMDHHVLLCPNFKVSSHVASLLKSAAPAKEEVLLKTLIVKGSVDGQFYGCLQDNASTDNFVTHRKAKAYNLTGRDVIVEIEGINSVESYQTILYVVPIRTLSGETKFVECFGLDSIATRALLPNQQEYRLLCDKLGVRVDQVVRPEQIDLLLSQREAYLMSDKVKKVQANMKLYSGPLGLVLSGSDSNLKFTDHRPCYPTVVREVSSDPLTTRVSTKFSKLRTKSDREILDFFEYEDVGVQSEGRRKALTIKDQREYKKFKDNMIYEESGTEIDPGPYWRITYPWEKPREAMPDNYMAVFGVMQSTARKLEKNEEWRRIYEKQLLDLVENRFAREIRDEELIQWKRDGLKTRAQ